MVAIAAFMSDIRQYDPAPQPADQVTIMREDREVRVMNPDGIAGREFGQWCLARSGNRIGRVPWVKWTDSTTVVEYVSAQVPRLGECPSGTHFEISVSDLAIMQRGMEAWQEHLQSVRSGIRVSFEAYTSGR